VPLIQVLDTNSISLEVMQWSRLEPIDDVKPIDDADAPCLEEIRQVLEKHGALSRFGVSLLHSHFELADDEMMLETTNQAHREHWVRPVKRAWLEEQGFAVRTTVVCFDEHGYHQNCGCAPLTSGHAHVG
jgi:hypothetical protein